MEPLIHLCSSTAASTAMPPVVCSPSLPAGSTDAACAARICWPRFAALSTQPCVSPKKWPVPIRTYSARRRESISSIPSNWKRTRKPSMPSSVRCTEPQRTPIRHPLSGRIATASRLRVRNCSANGSASSTDSTDLFWNVNRRMRGPRGNEWKELMERFPHIPSYQLSTIGHWLSAVGHRLFAIPWRTEKRADFGPILDNSPNCQHHPGLTVGTTCRSSRAAQ